MSNSQFGNNLLYLLSEKKSLKWTVFKKYIEYLYRQNKTAEHNKKDRGANHSKILEGDIKNFSRKQSYDFWRLARDLSAMAYLDMGGKTGETVVEIAPPMLAELPFWKPVFLLTGARSPELLRTIKKSVKGCLKIEIEIKTQVQLPDTVFIRPESKTILQEWLEDTDFQGNKLSDYIEISSNPPAWNILEFADSLMDYEKSLNEEWFSGDRAHIKEIFDINSLKFKPFNADKNSLKNDLSLVKIFYYDQDQFYKYYLFSKENENIVEIQPDWGKFLIMPKEREKNEKCSKTDLLILKYNKKTFELVSFLPMPYIFERGLALLSGQPPEKKNLNNSSFVESSLNPSFPRKQKSKKLSKQSSAKNHERGFIFKNVPFKIALLVAKKLEQNLVEN